MLDLTTSIDDFDGYTQVHCTIMTDPQQIAKPRQVVAGLQMAAIQGQKEQNENC